jgi:transposase
LLHSCYQGDVGDQTESAAEATPSLRNLSSWMREMIAEDRSDDLITGVVRLVDGIIERHIDQLRDAFKQHARELYGRKSEQLSEAQLELLFDLFREQVEEASTPELAGAAAQLDEAQPQDKPSEKSQRRRRKARDEAFAAALPRETVIVPVPESDRTCAACGDERALVGHDESEQLEYEPAQFRVRQIRREKRACRKCRDTVVRAPSPPRVVERGKLGAGLVAQVLVAKYLEHTPLYRQREIYKRSRVSLPRSTLGDAVAAACHHLLPLARRIQERVFAHDIVSTDDTGLRVLDPQHPKGSKRGFLWPYVAGHRWAYFAYTPSRAGAGPQAELADYAGYVQVDGYAGYDALFRGEGCPRIEVGCFMHARRYFVKAVDAGDLRALPAVAQIRALYAVEREAKDQGLDAPGRRALRAEQASPLLDELADWLEAMAPRATPKSPLGKAIGYAQKRWSALTRYLDDGRLEIDNGEVERLIRLVALGRKNYLFAGSDAGAERAAVAYTILATCTLHELDPWAYIQDVLKKIAGDWPQREIDRLLPDRWIEEHPDALRRSRPA